MKDVWKQENLIGVKKINKKKIAITIIIVILVVASIIIGGLYMSNKQIREWIDKNIFRKEVEQDTAITIELNEGQTGNIYAFNRVYRNTKSNEIYYLWQYREVKRDIIRYTNIKSNI